MKRVVWVLLAALWATGCFSVRHSYTGDKVMTSDAEIPGYRAIPVSHFRVHDRQFYWLHGGIPVGEPLNGAELAAREIASHDAVVNLRLYDGQDLIDSGVTHIACVLSLLCGTWSVWVEGDVVDLEAE